MSTNITTTTGVSASGSSRLHFGNNTNNYYYGNDSCNGEASSQSQQRTVSSTPSNENGLKLMRAAKAGQLPRVKYLIKMGANVCYHCDEDSTTPLHQAVLSGHEAVIEALIEAGANMDAEDNTGATPLHLALHKDIVRLLISAGADVDHEDYAGRTPGRRALELDKMDVVSALIDGNANRSKLYSTTKNTDGKEVSSSAIRGLVPSHWSANVVDGSHDRLIIGIATNGTWLEVAYALINDQTHLAWQTVRLQQIANNSVTDHQGHRPFSVSDIQGVSLDSFLSLPAGRPHPKLSYTMEILCESPESALFEFLKVIDEPLLRAIASRHPETFIDTVEKDYIVSISEPPYEEIKATGMKRHSDGGPLGVAWITELEACLQYAMPYNDDGQLEVGDFVVTCRNSRNIWGQNVALCAVYHVITLTPFRLRQLKQTQKCCEERIRKNWSITNVLTPRESIGPHMIQSENNKAWIAMLRRFVSTQSSWTRQANKVKAIVLLGGFTGGWANEAIAAIQEDHPQAQIVKHLLRNGPGGNLWKAARGAVALGVARQSQQGQAKNVEC